MARVRSFLMVLAIMACGYTLGGQAPFAEPAAVPPDCNQPELLTLGRPHMFSGAHIPRLGWSMKREEYRAGEPVLLYIWADNPTDESVPLWTCTDLESFKLRGFDLYDEKDHPLVRRKISELARSSRKKVDPCEEIPATCTRDLMLNVQPHTCVNGANYDFSTDLAEQYELTPGKYTIHAHTARETSEAACEDTRTVFRRNPWVDMTFSVIRR